MIVIETKTFKQMNTHPKARKFTETLIAAMKEFTSSTELHREETDGYISTIMSEVIASILAHYAVSEEHLLRGVEMHTSTIQRLATRKFKRRGAN